VKKLWRFQKETADRSFRLMKGIVFLRPVRVWLKSRVEARLMGCYITYAILCPFEYRVSRMGMRHESA